MDEPDKILILPDDGRPRKACAYCERSVKFTTQHLTDDLIDFCPNCTGNGNTFLHVGCIKRLHHNRSHLLHCTNPNCHNLFSEKYNNLSLRKSQEGKNAVFYRLFPVFWIGAGLCSAVFSLLYNECVYRNSVIECYIVAVTLEALSAALFIMGFFTKLTNAGFYLRFTGSKKKADQRLNIELTVVVTCTMFGLLPIIALPFLFDNNIPYAIWIFFFHFLLLPAALWRVIRYVAKMKIEVAGLRVALNRVSVVDLRAPREQFLAGMSAVNA